MATGFELTTALGPDKLFFGRMVGRESLGEPYRYEFHLLGNATDVDFDDLVGTHLSMKMDFGASDPRYFSGVITRISHAGSVRSHDHYVAIVRPQFWLLKQSADCRIFQDETIADVIKTVLKENGVTLCDELKETYQPVAYCVQYRESNFAFVSRLMEQVGISYFFKHSDSGHEMVLVDGTGSHSAIDGEATIPFHRIGTSGQHLAHIWDFQPGRAATSGSFVTTDYDFEKPRADLETKALYEGAYDLEQGEVYDYPGKYTEAADGEAYTKVQLQARQVADSVGTGEGNVLGLAAGGLFTLEKFPRKADNIEYLLTETDLRIEGFDFEDPGDRRYTSDEDFERAFRIRFKAIPGDVTFRNLPRTPRPMMGGPQTAVVVGKSGEEIWTDKYGRIKVQFHWDRLGEKDENTTCWMRVAQAWAGSGWGSIFIPRIGQEVIVQFLEGDVDQPIVIGSLYNADQMPPYSLPDNQTQSGIKTRSTKAGTNETFNELRFEDKKDEEQIYLHAETDFHRVVENNDTLEVGLSKGEKSGEGNQTIDIYNDRTITLEKGNDSLTIKEGDRTTEIKKGDLTLTVSEGERTETIENNDALTIKSGNHSIDVDSGTSKITAARSIKLVVGGSSIEITSSGITLKAPKIEIKGDTKVDVSSAMTTVKASGIMTVKGSVVKIN
ncbi:Phage-related baseplate assembly protein [Novipirellula galeiformis]|uniref:Phage-related baseplate assembly protein n=1 Tax=Novipirellula galeiformis TaxID=2528004 RepID=A0A5C6CJ20_9BACT|nr:type VI secretion system tip protein TssI/VgrG [Novipirellula galeiformis]TWU23444.1 Phage-related baseplate assembly protein [Novipirellula galeiformis]